MQENAGIFPGGKVMGEARAKGTGGKFGVES